MYSIHNQNFKYGRQFQQERKGKEKKKEKKDKAELKKQRKADGLKQEEFLYMDEDGNLTPVKPDPNAKKKEISLESIEVSVPKKVDTGENMFEKEGKVKFFNTEKGYGFIVDKLSGDSFFVHMDNLLDKIKDNDLVVFEIGTGNRGPVAIKVRLQA